MRGSGKGIEYDGNVGTETTRRGRNWWEETGRGLGGVREGM